MSKRKKSGTSDKPKRPRDPNLLGHQLVRESTEKHETEQPGKPTKSEIARVMAEMGRRGGKLGGVARAQNLTEEQRREIARKAARKRWDKNSTATHREFKVSQTERT